MMASCLSLAIAAASTFFAAASAQTYQRLGVCPTLGRVFPPDQQDFLAGQYFDIRLEVHAPIDGSEATNGIPDEDFAFAISKVGGAVQPATGFFDLTEPELETWSFPWYEDLFAADADAPSIVNVASKAYRRVALYEAGKYEATLWYNNTNTTVSWLVRDMSEVRRTKNVLLFIGDGMTTNMITAARLIAHNQINGCQSTMAMDKFPVLDDTLAVYLHDGFGPDCLGTDASDQPGLKEITLKAIDILNSRATDNGWLIMSEAASIDKQMHALDYYRALGELLELDDTIEHSIAYLEALGILNETLVVVTADHGHGFDVFENADTKYLNTQTTDRAKRNAIGVYQNGGESQYVNTGSLRYADSDFPSNWDPRYTLGAGCGRHAWSSRELSGS